MSYRRTLVFLIIFAVLATAFYLYEYKGAEARKKAEERENLILLFEPGEVTALVLEKPDLRIAAQKENEGWRIAEPVQAPGEEKTIERMVDQLAELKYERDLGVQSDLEPFGLERPESEIEVKAGETTFGRLLLGASTPDGRNFYVKRSTDQRVFTALSSAKTGLDRTLFDMRDKTVFDFSTPDVSALTISRADNTFRFRKGSDGEWLITEPEQHEADLSRITDLLDSIRFSKVRKFVEEDAWDLEQYGLESPQARIELVVGGDANTLSLGGRTGSESKRVYARKGEGRRVVELDADILEALTGKLSDWRDKRLVRFERADVTKLAIEAPSGRIALERVPGDAGQWRMTEPEAAPADEDKVRDLLSGLQAARIARFLDEEEMEQARPVFENRSVRVALWEEDRESPHTVSLAAAGDDAEAYARVREDGEIFAVARELAEELSVQPGEMKDRSVLSFAPADIRKVGLTVQGESFEIEREDVGWEMPRDLEMESYEIDQLLWDLGDLKYRAILPAQQDEGEYGFDSPTLTLALWKKDEETPLQLIVGKKVAGRDIYYVRASGEERAMEIEGALISEWVSKFGSSTEELRP